MNDFDKSVDRVIEQYKAAVLARDADAFMRLYDPKARIFDAWGAWQYSDAAAWRRAIEGWFSAHPGDKFKVTFEDVHVSGSADAAIVTAIVTYASMSAAGEQKHALQNRLSWGLRTSGHVLRIVHEHTSFPVGFDDQKAMLQTPTKA